MTAGQWLRLNVIAGLGCVVNLVADWRYTEISNRKQRLRMVR